MAPYREEHVSVPNTVFQLDITGPANRRNFIPEVLIETLCLGLTDTNACCGQHRNKITSRSDHVNVNTVHLTANGTQPISLQGQGVRNVIS